MSTFSAQGKVRHHSWENRRLSAPLQSRGSVTLLRCLCHFVSLFLQHCHTVRNSRTGTGSSLPSPGTAPDHSSTQMFIEGVSDLLVLCTKLD